MPITTFRQWITTRAAASIATAVAVNGITGLRYYEANGSGCFSDIGGTVAATVGDQVRNYTDGSSPFTRSSGPTLEQPATIAGRTNTNNLKVLRSNASSHWLTNAALTASATHTHITLQMATEPRTAKPTYFGAGGGRTLFPYTGLNGYNGAGGTFDQYSPVNVLQNQWCVVGGIFTGTTTRPCCDYSTSEYTTGGYTAGTGYNLFTNISGDGPSGDISALLHLIHESTAISVAQYRAIVVELARWVNSHLGVDVSGITYPAPQQCTSLGGFQLGNSVQDYANAASVSAQYPTRANALLSSPASVVDWRNLSGAAQGTLVGGTVGRRFSMLGVKDSFDETIGGFDNLPNCYGKSLSEVIISCQEGTNERVPSSIPTFVGTHLANWPNIIVGTPPHSFFQNSVDADITACHDEYLAQSWGGRPIIVCNFRSGGLSPRNASYTDAYGHFEAAGLPLAAVVYAAAITAMQAQMYTITGFSLVQSSPQVVLGEQTLQLTFTFVGTGSYPTTIQTGVTSGTGTISGSALVTAPGQSASAAKTTVAWCQPTGRADLRQSITINTPISGAGGGRRITAPRRGRS